jgi:hypothetical protein
MDAIILVENAVGYGRNNSSLSKSECLNLLANPYIATDTLSNDDLDSLYFVVNNRFAYHQTRESIIENINKNRQQYFII